MCVGVPQSRSKTRLKKKSGRSTERWRNPLGHSSNSTRERPLILRIEEAEAPHATSFSNASEKENWKPLKSH